MYDKFTLKKMFPICFKKFCDKFTLFIFRFRTFSLNPKTGVWEESSAITVDNMYTVTSITWKRDGSRLLVGSLCGGLDVYDACIRRYRYKGKFEMIFVSPSQVIVKRISNGNFFFSF